MQNRQRALVILLVWVLVWVFALATGRRLSYQVAYLITAVVGGALFFAWSNVRWVRVRRYTRSRRSQVGRPVEESLAVTNIGRVPKLWLEVHDFSTLPGHRVSQVVPGLRGGRTYRWHVRTSSLVRGVFRLGPMALISSDPLGLFTFRRHIPQSHSIVVYPYAASLPYFALPEGRLPGGAALRRRAHHVTTNVAGVRDYAPGDAFNHIHWPTTARVGRLMAKEFELDPLADVWLVLDMQAGVYVGTMWDSEATDISSLLGLRRDTAPLPPHGAEYAVAAAASLGRYFLLQQRSLGLITYSGRRRMLPPDRGERQLYKLLEMLALVQPTGRVPLQQVLLAELPQFGRHTTVIVITGDWTRAWVTALEAVRQRGVRTVAVLVDGASFGAVPPVDTVQAHLVQAGVPTYVVRQGDDLSAVLSRG